MSLRDGVSKAGTCSTKTNYIYMESCLRRNQGIMEICLSWKNLPVQISWSPADPY